jgi:mannosyl-oligosaccharide alpha-1,2-mannosidase
MDDEFGRARRYISKEFSPRGNWTTHGFVARFIGGFLSAYDISSDELFLDRATNWADAFLDCVDNETGCRLNR